MQGNLGARGKINYGHLEANAREASSAVARRLGYLLALLKLRPIKMGARSGLRWLGPTGAKKEIGTSKRWGLLLNLTEAELMQWKWA